MRVTDLVCIISLFFVILFIKTDSILAYSTTENFNGVYDWSWQNFDGYQGISFESDADHEFIRIKNYSNSFFAFLEYPIESNFIGYIEVKYRYHNNPVNQGAGIVISKNLPNRGDSVDPSKMIYWIWDIPTTEIVTTTSICPSTENNCQQTYFDGGYKGLPDSWHLFRFEIYGDRYEAYMDGVKVYTSIPTSEKTNAIWLGNPQNMINLGQLWPTIDIDYIKYSNFDLPTVSPTSEPTDTPTPTLTSSPTPSPSPFPTPDPTPEPTPTPERIKTIVLPGLGGSWDTKALLSGEPGDHWILPVFVTTYENLLTSLVNAGYRENKDLFVFSYDWRKPIQDAAEDLKNFIDKKIAEGKISTSDKLNLIGHSYGGLVSMAFAHKNPDEINKVVTLGSPHLGAVDAYPTWEGATMQTDNWVYRAALELSTQLAKKSSESPVDTVHRTMPGLKDLLPTFDYLKENGVLVQESKMNERNSTLLAYDNQAGEISSLLYANSGIDSPTHRYIKVVDRSWADRLLGRWVDGKPLDKNPYENINEGDGTVLTMSAKGSFTLGETIATDHGGLVNSQQGIEKIFDELGLDRSKILTNALNDNRSTAFVAALRSPGVLHICRKIICDEDLGVFPDSDKKLFIIPGYDNEDLDVSVKANGETGRYDLWLGSLQINTSDWEKFSGNLHNTNQEDKYLTYVIEGDLWVGKNSRNVKEGIDILVEELSDKLSFFDWDLKFRLRKIQDLEHFREDLSRLIQRAHERNQPEIIELSLKIWLRSSEPYLREKYEHIDENNLRGLDSLVREANKKLKLSTSVDAARVYESFTRVLSDLREEKQLSVSHRTDLIKSAKQLLELALKIK